ncbi:MAG: hypothetical protein ACR2MP_02605 [Streptosporangiaceae bacterium]
MSSAALISAGIEALICADLMIGKDRQVSPGDFGHDRPINDLL